MSKLFCDSETKLVLIELGPAGKAMISDVAEQWYQVVDIGQVDMDYEWYLRGAEDSVKNILISIITVSYNSAETIEQTIKSVISQNDDNLEYIIIDGGSKDGTVDIIRKYEEEVSFWVSEPDEGIYDAMNKGLAHAHGEVIAFLNSDDWYEEGTIRKVRDYFEKNDADIISGEIYRVLNEVPHKYTVKRENKDDIFFKMIYAHPALFAKTELFRLYGGFDCKYRIAADYDWVLRMVMKGVKILAVDDYFTYFRYGGLSSSEICKALEEQYASAKFYLEKEKKEYLVEGIQNYYAQEFKKARGLEKYIDALHNHIDVFRKLFDIERIYYIWGTGIRGERSYELFRKLNLKIGGFIDSDKKMATLHDLPVFSAAECPHDGSICITPKDFEEEIKGQLKAIGVYESSFFTFSDVMDKVTACLEMQKDGI